MNFETLRTTVGEGIFTLTLKRPERLNAFNGRMHQELLQACRLLVQPGLQIAQECLEGERLAEDNKRSHKDGARAHRRRDPVALGSH